MVVGCPALMVWMVWMVGTVLMELLAMVIKSLPYVGVQVVQVVVRVLERQALEGAPMEILVEQEEHQAVNAAVAVAAAAVAAGRTMMTVAMEVPAVDGQAAIRA